MKWEAAFQATHVVRPFFPPLVNVLQAVHEYVERLACAGVVQLDQNFRLLADLFFDAIALKLFQSLLLSHKPAHLSK